jgi:hypothetical protein
MKKGQIRKIIKEEVESVGFEKSIRFNLQLVLTHVPDETSAEEAEEEFSYLFSHLIDRGAFRSDKFEISDWDLKKEES